MKNYELVWDKTNNIKRRGFGKALANKNSYQKTMITFYIVKPQTNFWGKKMPPEKVNFIVCQ